MSWWETHLFIDAAIRRANVGPLPAAGSPSWRELSDDDPRKLLALAVAGQHHVLRVETAQHIRAEASRAVSGAADWPKIAREMQRLSEFRRMTPWSRRATR